MMVCVTAHVQMVEPLPRGQLRGTKRAPTVQAVDPAAPVDFFAFFPAGDKNPKPGSGKRSQQKAAKTWKVFDPMQKGFPWRAGICGDLKNQRPQEHKRGGRYYHGGMIAKTYKAGSVIDLKLSMNQNHNGYFVFHVCNVDKCGGEIATTCFHNGACRRLERARTHLCDRRRTKLCGPIDRNHKDRWYLPCAKNAVRPSGIDNYGFKKEVRYRLPDRFTCDHCVLHFYYTSANSCLPPGTAEYFTGPDKPSWGKCRGESGAIGQFVAHGRTCGGKEFSEEYYNCADIRILPR